MWHLGFNPQQHPHTSHHTLSVTFHTTASRSHLFTCVLHVSCLSSYRRPPEKLSSFIRSHTHIQETNFKVLSFISINQDKSLPTHTAKVKWAECVLRFGGNKRQKHFYEADWHVPSAIQRTWEDAVALPKMLWHHPATMQSFHRNASKNTHNCWAGFCLWKKSHGEF